MDEDLEDRTLCPLCNLPLSEQEYLECPRCGRGAHTGCWQRVGRCATRGCDGRPAMAHEMTTVAAEAEETRRCRSCGYEFQPLETRCPRCSPQDTEGLRRVAAEQSPKSRSRFAGAPESGGHMLRSVETARRGPTSDPFRRITDPNQELPPVARGNLLATPAPTAGEQATAPAGVRPPRVEVENTSGSLGKIPREALGWNWGALLLGPIWLLGHGQLGLAVVWGGLAAAAVLIDPHYRLLPGAALVMLALYLGAVGNRLAWKARHYPSLAHFHRAQRAWAGWAVGILLAGLVIGGAISFMAPRATVPGVPAASH